MLRGLDVSAVQSHVDWQAVAASGCRFAIVKGVEGNRPAPDPMFASHVRDAHGAGLVVGAYHFAYPLPFQPGNGLRDPADQAKHHHDLSGGYGSHDGELPPFLDLEWPAPADWAKWGCTAEQIRAWALAYLAAATALWGVQPIVYTYPDFWVHVGGAKEAAFAQYGFWLASYPHATTWPAADEEPSFILAPWTNWTFWQFSGGAMSLPNGGPVDYDVFNGGDAQLRNLTTRSPRLGETAQAALAQAANDPGRAS